jgi:hypothetical protein
MVVMGATIFLLFLEIPRRVLTSKCSLSYDSDVGVET